MLGAPVKCWRRWSCVSNLRKWVALQQMAGERSAPLYLDLTRICRFPRPYCGLRPAGLLGLALAQAHVPVRSHYTILAPHEFWGEPSKRVGLWRCGSTAGPLTHMPRPTKKHMRRA